MNFFNSLHHKQEQKYFIQTRKMEDHLEFPNKQLKSQQQQQNNANQLIAIKTPYHITNSSTITKIITPSILQQIQEHQDNIVLSADKMIEVSKKKNAKPLCEVKIAKYRNKITGQIIQKIEDYQFVNIQYDFTRLTDFYRFSLNHKQVTQDKIIQIMKNNVTDSNNKQINFQFIAPLPPFLKTFNSHILPIDILQNRIKSNAKNFIKSKQIAFDDEIPLPPQQIPEYISKSKIFTIIQSYFQKRPCWLRNVLVYQLRQDGFKGQFTINELKNVLKFFSYTFRDGPWKHVFCRFDFKPLDRVEACLFQSVLIKIKQKEVEDYDKQIQMVSEQDNVYDPTMKQIPGKFMKFYQLVDIEYARVQQIVETATMSNTQCTKQYGWFTKKQFTDLQSILKDIRDTKFL